MNPDRMLKLLQTRDIKTRYFAEKLFAEPAWYMLLDPMDNHLLQSHVSVTSRYIASGVSASTASPRQDEMEEQGLVQRWDDSNDGRTQYARPTERIIDLMTAYLLALGKQFQPCRLQYAVSNASAHAFLKIFYQCPYGICLLYTGEIILVLHLDTSHFCGVNFLHRAQ